MNRALVTVARIAPGASSHGFRWMTFPRYRGALAGLPSDVELIAVGACLGLEPIGLAVVELCSGGARLVSVLVRPNFRGRGVARRMMTALELAAAVEGASTMSVGGADHTIPSDVRGLLVALGYGAFTAAGVCFELETKKLGPILSRRRRWLPAAFTAVPWVGLDEQQRRAVGEGWYPESLSPFRHEAHVEPTTSLALITNDTVVGWAIGHRFSSRAVHYSTIFVREDLRNLGVGAGLFFTGLTLHCTSEETRDLRGRFVVRDESERMLRLIDRRFSGLTTRRTPFFETHKPLASV